MQSQNPKRKRNRLPLEEKLNLIKAADDGKSQEWLARQFSISHSTVSIILKKKATLLGLASKKSFLPKKTIRSGDEIQQEMEIRLKEWILLHTRFNIPLSKDIIQVQALILYEDVKRMKSISGSSIASTSTAGASTADTSTAGNSITKEFHASNGWLQRFLQREELHSIKLQGEAASADREAAERFPKELDEIITNGGYSRNQIFNVDETGLLWKKMPQRSYIQKEDGVMPGHKVAKDRITLLLGGNADGSLKLKPVLIHKYGQPRALKNCPRENLPVIYKAQSKAWMTSQIFVDWFRDDFKREVEEFCRVRQIPFKILLILDNAPGHPEIICNMFDEIQVIFLPPNTTSLIQPMDQGVIANFKSYYMRNTFRFVMANLESAADEDKARALRNFWKNFNIADAIRVVDLSWSEVTQSAMAGVWKKIISSQSHGNIIEDLGDEISRIASRLNLELTESDIRELLNSHDVTLTEAEILELCQENSMEENIEDETAPDSSNSEALRNCFKALNSDFIALQLVDKNHERGNHVVQKCREIIEEYYKAEFDKYRNN